MAGNSKEAWRAIREEQAAKEQTEMMKIVGAVLVIFAVAWLINRRNKRSGILKARALQSIDQMQA